MLNKYVIRTNNTAFRIIDGEAVIMSLKDNTLHTINGVGSRIWELSDGNMTLGEIIDSIIGEYDIDYEEGKSDCIEFVNELQDKDMLELIDKKTKK